MMGQQAGNQERLFYRFYLGGHVPADHLLRGIDRFLDLSALRQQLAPFYSSHRKAVDRPGAAGPDAARRLLLWDLLGAAAVRGGTPESRLSVVLRAGA
jgi:hypothetical protein